MRSETGGGQPRACLSTSMVASVEGLGALHNSNARSTRSPRPSGLSASRRTRSRRPCSSWTTRVGRVPVGDHESSRVARRNAQPNEIQERQPLAPAPRRVACRRIPSREALLRRPLRRRARLRTRATTCGPSRHPRRPGARRPGYAREVPRSRRPAEPSREHGAPRRSAPGGRRSRARTSGRRRGRRGRSCPPRSGGSEASDLARDPQRLVVRGARLERARSGAPALSVRTACSGGSGPRVG